MDRIETIGRRPQDAIAPTERRAAATSADVEDLLRKFREREARIGVVGLGYVGLPLSLAACEAGYSVVGFDINEQVVEELNGAHSPFPHIAAERIQAARKDDRFVATGNGPLLGEVDAILICVPTPLGPHREPDLSFVVATAETVAQHLRPGQLVVLESTTYPGTTREVVKPILEATGLRSGIDFFLAYSPEREDPGNLDFQTSRIPKVVAGDGEAALRLASTMYQQFVISTVPVSSPETAEAVKLTENVFRAVNIALVNELKTVYGAIGVDIFEVVDAASTKPFGYMPFYPGPGLGGHCIPIDPFYLTWKARELGISTRFIELAGEVNTSMPRYVVDRLREELDRRYAKALSGARILVVGIAYKKNVADLRESPALTIMELLDALGARVDYHDPHFPMIPPTRRHAALAGKAVIPLEPCYLARYDAVVIVTDHDEVDYLTLLRYSKLVVDTRNVVAGLAGPEHASVVVKA
ncbi:nucleotide sugar dehydrogenase [Arenibaculum pallidiluteum]|uniref:nucleotide sugar dehydrogenase n=1 Tax=Arenibaculum pallidiluteum TaxID=2812559 RepID=UPI001A96DCDD|nr:nucleotide sugar dehydrogenase [Arenibaculum pallidiluteum]